MPWRVPAFEPPLESTDDAEVPRPGAGRSGPRTRKLPSRARSSVLSVFLVAAVTAAGGCSALGIEVPALGSEDELDEDRATDLVESHLTEIDAALPQSSRLDSVGAAVSSRCEPDDLVRVTKKYRVVKLPEKEYEETVDALSEHWSLNGYTVQEDMRPDELFLSVESPDDEFSVSVQQGEDDLMVSSTSPCVIPSE
ncbi:hypothetical protein [Nocardiopsis coralliicola]